MRRIAPPSRAASARRRQPSTFTLASLLAALATLAAVWPTQASAQAFPSRPVRIVIGFPPGGGIDIVARLLTPHLAETFGQPVVVENRPGAGGNLAMDLVAKAAPDGHTLFLGTTGNLAVNQALYEKMPVVVERDMAPVTQLASVAFLFYVNNDLPVKSLADLVAYAKANPGKVNYGSSSSGGLPHLACELFSQAAGVKTVHVPYKGSAPALADLMGGQIQFMVDAAALGLQQVRAGKVRAIATSGPRRLAFLPDVPAANETLPGFDVVNWYGATVPAATPRAAIDRWHAALVKAMAQPEVREKMIAQGTDPVGTTPAEFATFLRQETVRWTRVVREANIKVD
jgi:tripartite-type tricarboxylate transporter receptor subunit TctC